MIHIWKTIAKMRKYAAVPSKLGQLMLHINFDES